MQPSFSFFCFKSLLKFISPPTHSPHSESACLSVLCGVVSAGGIRLLLLSSFRSAAWAEGGRGRGSGSSGTSCSVLLFAWLSVHFTRACLRLAKIQFRCNLSPKQTKCAASLCMATAIRASAPRVPHAPHRRWAPRAQQAPSRSSSPGPLLKDLARLSDPRTPSSVDIWDRHGLRGQHPPPARGCRGCEGIRARGVPRPTRLHESPPSRGLWVGGSTANFGEPLPRLGPLARVAPHLTFPGRRASRPQSRPAARFRLIPPPAFVWTRRRSQRAWGRISLSKRCQLSATLFSSPPPTSRCIPSPSAFSLCPSLWALPSLRTPGSLLFLPVSFILEQRILIHIPFCLAISPVCFFFFPYHFLTVSFLDSLFLFLHFYCFFALSQFLFLKPPTL